MTDPKKQPAPSGVVDYDAFANCREKLKDANERIVEFEGIKVDLRSKIDQQAARIAELEAEVEQIRQFNLDEGLKLLDAIKEIIALEDKLERAKGELLALGPLVEKQAFGFEGHAIQARYDQTLKEIGVE